MLNKKNNNKDPKQATFNNQSALDKDTRKMSRISIVKIVVPQQ